MAKTITVNVTAEHIAQGVARSSCSCPVALALRERFPDSIVSVTRNTIYLESKNLTTRTKTPVPQSVGQFVRRFDQIGKEAVEPFQFAFDGAEGFDDENA